MVSEKGFLSKETLQELLQWAILFLKRPQVQIFFPIISKASDQEEITQLLHHLPGEARGIKITI